MGDAMPSFDYCTPAFLGFQSDSPDDADAIFRNNTRAGTADDNSIPEISFKIKQERISVFSNEPEEPNYSEDPLASAEIKQEPNCTTRPLRRSMSVNNLLDAVNARAPKYYLKKQASVENINKDAHVKTESSNDVTITEKFISMAERIYHMEKDTPKRFRSTMAKPDSKLVLAALNRKRAQEICRSTIPQSPALMTKTRVRPVSALSREQIEQREIEQIQNFHIKANPVPRGVIEGIANLAPVQRRPPTKPEPFNITQIKKKLPQPIPNYKFTAKPVAPGVLEGPVGIGKKVALPITQPMTPKFMKMWSFVQSKKHSHSIEDNLKASDRSTVSDRGPSRTGPLKAQPFSFEERDKAMLVKKQAKIDNQIEEEKRLCVFKANPILAVCKKRLTAQSPRKSNENKENNEVIPVKFEAKPPLVLYREPFKPMKADAPMTAACPFSLNTEKRAVERQRFDDKIRQNEIFNEERQKQLELQRIEEEKKEVAKLRSQQVHKANPIRHYPAVQALKEIALTIPMSPQFQSKRK